jgi:glutamine synthetase
MYLPRREPLDTLEAEHGFLLKGDAFTKDAIEMWINYKRTKEVDALRLWPHLYEFFLYYNI